MSHPSVHQALFGYREGHDVLASSIDFDKETLRLLRSATDVNTEGLLDRFVSTVLPLPNLKCHAFVRSWSAQDAPRPGSVFAHVLMVDLLTLGRLGSFEGIRGLFSKPSGAASLSLYSEMLAWNPKMHATPTPYGLGLSIAARLYTSNETVHVTHNDLESAEAVLYGLLAQQWPKLRREFAFRTRLRPSETTWRVDVEVSGRGDEHPIDEPRWAVKLASDLIDSDPNFRKFLWRYGAESKRGRVDMPLLVELFEAERAGDLMHAADILSEQYRRPKEMRILKREVFGFAPNPSRDLDALRAILKHPDSFDLESLDIGERISRAAESEPIAIRAVVAQLDLSGLGDSIVSVLAESIARHANADMLASIAQSNPDLAVLVVGLRPVLLGIPEVWEAADDGLLTDVFFSANQSEQTEVLRMLVRASSTEALAAICARQPEIWWDLLSEVSRLASPEQAKVASALGETLSRIGTAAIGAPTGMLSDSDLGVLLQAADLKNGLWRRVEPSRWLELAGRSRKSNWPAALRDRAAAVALNAGNSSLSADVRSQAWRSTFEFLHERLKDAQFDDQAWTLLSGSLPAAPSWDRCLRLRRGVVAEVRRDRWPGSASEELVRQSRGYEEEMRLEIDRINNPHRSWLEELLGRITGTN